MKEITLGQMTSNLKLKIDDDIIVYTESRAFKGKFLRVGKLNSELVLEVSMKFDGDEECMIDLEIDVDVIIAIGKVRNEGFRIVPDSQINEDLKKSEEE